MLMGRGFRSSAGRLRPISFFAGRGSGRSARWPSKHGPKDRRPGPRVCSRRISRAARLQGGPAGQFVTLRFSHGVLSGFADAGQISMSVSMAGWKPAAGATAGLSSSESTRDATLLGKPAVAPHITNAPSFSGRRPAIIGEGHVRETGHILPRIYSRGYAVLGRQLLGKFVAAAHGVVWLPPPSCRQSSVALPGPRARRRATASLTASRACGGRDPGLSSTFRRIVPVGKIAVLQGRTYR